MAAAEVHLYLLLALLQPEHSLLLWGASSLMLLGCQQLNSIDYSICQCQGLENKTSRSACRHPEAVTGHVRRGGLEASSKGLEAVECNLAPFYPALKHLDSSWTWVYKTWLGAVSSG